MAANFAEHLVVTPPGTVRMNINQDIDKETVLASGLNLLSVALKPGAVIEFFAEGMHVASFQVTEDGKDVYATEGLDEKELADTETRQAERTQGQ